MGLIFFERSELILIGFFAASVLPARRTEMCVFRELYHLSETDIFFEIQKKEKMLSVKLNVSQFEGREGLFNLRLHYKDLQESRVFSFDLSN